MFHNRFQWENLPTRLIRAIAQDVGLAEGATAADLAEMYGTPPGEEFVRGNWEVLRDEWLPDADDARHALVAELWEFGVGYADKHPRNRSGLAGRQVYAGRTHGNSCNCYLPTAV